MNGTLGANCKLSDSNFNTSNQLTVHHYTGLAVEAILKNSLYRQSLDNVTVVMVAFSNFKRVVCDAEKPASAAV